MNFQSIGNSVQKTFSSEDFKAWVAQCTEQFNITIICSREMRYEREQALSELEKLFKHYHEHEQAELINIAHFSINDQRKVHVTTAHFIEQGERKQHLWLNNLVKKKDEWLFDSSTVYVDVDAALLKKFRFNTSILYQQKFD